VSCGRPRAVADFCVGCVIQFRIRWHLEASTKSYARHLGKMPKPSSHRTVLPKPRSRWRPTAAGKIKQSGNGRKSRTGTISCCGSENLTTICKKGKQVYIEGRIENRSWKTKKPEAVHHRIVCDELILTSVAAVAAARFRGWRVFPAARLHAPVSAAPAQAPAAPAAPADDYNQGITDDDVPF